jgi:hypothetical protein
MIGWYLAFILLAVWALAFWLNRRGVRRHECSGDPAEGIVIFAEPVRWLFVIWGFSPVCRGLRRAGWHGQVRLFRWSTPAGALLVVPDVIRQRRLLRYAANLARVIDRLAGEYPDAPIHLCGYSSGCYVAIEAVRRVRSARVQTAWLLSGTISPGYSFDWLDENGPRVFNVNSQIDLLNLLGPLIIGTNDRRWTPSCGALGFTSRHPALTQRQWTLRDVRRFYFGDHFTVVAPGFAGVFVAPRLLQDSPASQAARAVTM